MIADEDAPVNTLMCYSPLSDPPAISVTGSAVTLDAVNRSCGSTASYLAKVTFAVVHNLEASYFVVSSHSPGLHFTWLHAGFRVPPVWHVFFFIDRLFVMTVGTLGDKRATALANLEFFPVCHLLQPACNSMIIFPGFNCFVVQPGEMGIVLPSAISKTGLQAYYRVLV